MDLKKIVKLIESELYRFSEIEFAYLFGSVLKRDLAKADDIYIAIFFKDSLSAEKIIQKKIKLESLLSIKLGKEIEISPLNFSDPLFTHQVLSNKLVLVDRNHRLRLIEEAKWRNEYFDMQPLWKVYRKKVYGIG